MIATQESVGVDEGIASLRAKFGLPGKRAVEQVEVSSSDADAEMDVRISTTCMHEKLGTTLAICYSPSHQVLITMNASRQGHSH